MYNNDPKYMNPQQGLASLVNSPYGDSDIMQVKMTPNEVAGLQQLAVSYGANEQDLYDPVTGQPRFNFLKKLLPMIIGAVLPGVPGLGNFAQTIGFGSKALGSALLVGGATALIEGDLKKGLMAGLGAYSGANLSQALQASASAAAAPRAEEIVKAAEGVDVLKETVGANAVINPTEAPVVELPRAMPKINPFTGGAPTTSQLGNMSFASAANAAIPPPATGIRGIFQGAQNLFTSPESRKAFGESLGGGFQSPFAQNLSKSATFMGAMNAFTPEAEAPPNPYEDEVIYQTGGFNPMYGYGREHGYFLPGQYFKRTKKGLVPYNPYAKAPGYADGGPVTGGGRGPEEDDPRNLVGVAPPVPPPFIPPATTPFDPARQRYMDMVNAPPKPPVDTKPVMDYVAELNRRAKNPEFMTFPPGGIGPPPGPPGGPPGGPPDPNCEDGYTYDKVSGACVPIGSLPPPPPPPSPPGPPGTTITPPAPPPPPPPPPKKDEPEKTEPEKTEPKQDEPKKDLKDKAVDLVTDAVLNQVLARIHPSLPIARYIWGALPKKTQNTIKKIFSPQVFDMFGKPAEPQTPEDEAENAEALAELEAAKAKAEAEANKTQPPPSGGRGGSSPINSGGATGRLQGGNPFGGGSRGAISVSRGYIDNGDGTFSDIEGNIYDGDGNLIEDARIAARSGGRIRAMQAGGMTTPPSALPEPYNPYGAAVGEDFNFGFSGGGATEYAAAGKLLDGPGDGMSDDIPAVIRGKGEQRAALADGEFVVPADVVSHLGNGSTKAGAKKLYAMMDRIREARTGRTRQSPAVKADKYLPA